MDERCVSKISWDELLRRMKDAGVRTFVPFEMIKCFKESNLSFLGYGSRFNTANGCKAVLNSDWDMLVECSSEEWKMLLHLMEERIGLWFYTWSCERVPGLKMEKFPVLSNYNCGFKSSNAISLRQINDRKTDIFNINKEPSNWTEIR